MPSRGNKENILTKKQKTNACDKALLTVAWGDSILSIRLSEMDKNVRGVSISNE